MLLQLHREDYTVGWVCALPVELAAARGMLDEKHETPQIDSDDPNIYTCGRVGKHNVVIACLPEGQMGTNSATQVAVHIKSTFTSIQFGLMVGIGGGVPSNEADDSSNGADVRLGDVVISKPCNKNGGVVQYDFGKTTPKGFERTGFLNAPPTILLNAVANLQANHISGEYKLSEYLSRFHNNLPEFRREAAGPDNLFKAEYDHEGGATCNRCNKDYLIAPKLRSRDVVVHYGTIASGNQVMRNAIERNRVSAELGGVLCFEMEAAGLMNSFPCLVIRGICDYADSHKNKKWQAYAAGTASACAKEVLSMILPTAVANSHTVKEVISGASEWGDDERKCSQALRTATSEYEDFKNRNPNPVKGTCQWVLQHLNFIKWKTSSHSSLLWVSADPGCGKSTLSKFLVDEDLKQRDATTCYFFFKDDNCAQNNTATAALSAVLHQLFNQKPMLIRHAMSAFAANGNSLPQLFDTLWDILTNAAADPEAGNVFCVLDGLDECVEGGRYKIISTLSTFHQQGSSRKNASRLKICVTSRPYLDIKRRFTGVASSFPTIRLEQESEAICREIDLVIRSRISDLKSELVLTDSEMSILETKLLGATQRTYLWVKLIFDIIGNIYVPTPRELEAAIDTLPSTVSEVYEAILARVKGGGQRKRAQKVLHIIMAATRPLTLQEMNIALAIEDQNCYDDLKLDLDDAARFEASVRDLCGLFIIVADQKVYLIHQTAREFLLAKSNTVTLKWENSLIPAQSETILARICLTYLSLMDFNEGTSTSAVYGFMTYAADSWAIHYRKVENTATKQMLQQVLKICDPLSTYFKIWFFKSWGRSYFHPFGRQQFTSTLMVGSYFGHATVVKLLLEGQADVDSKDSFYGRTSLLWAAENGHEVVVTLLLEHKANVDSKDSYRETPLSRAARNGHEAVVMLLLEHKARVNSKDSHRETPLSHAARNGHEAVVKLLLEHKAKVDSKDQGGRTPLSWAARNGHEAVVKLLLEHKAEVDLKDQDGWMSLSWAAKNGHEAVVKLLLEHKADVNLKDSSYGRTSLSWAAENGHEAVVKLLLEHKADANSRDSSYGLTPLSWAAENGHEVIVALLLEHKANIDSKDPYSETPLSWAAKNGNEAVVKLLLEHKANVDSKDKGGQTPLSWAARKGHKAVVKLLLTHKANVDSRDLTYGRTSLSWAARNGHEAVVKLLLEHKVNVDSKDKDGRTALSWAVYIGHKPIVILLQSFNSR